MSYSLGVDLGTTFSAAAICRGDRVEVVALGGKGDTIPSVVLLREDGTLLTGDAAVRRGVTEPHRMVREFKRRFGQPEPIMLGGTPYSPEALSAALLRAIVDVVVAREGEWPERICLTHPANWGPFKRDLFEHVVRLAEIPVPVDFAAEPEAAAVSYARSQRVEPGTVVAVYDLGGGTFDAAALRCTDAGFEILGQPEGIEQLGGIDVDAAVFHHVAQAIGSRLSELDEDDPVALAAVARLKRDCVDAKEALSADTDVAIPVLLPDYSSQVRLTRAELESMVRPMLAGTIAALRRALQSAHVAPADVGSVLLVGGASRMPIVAQLVGAELGRPVAVDAHPKHVVAVGAAWLAAGAAAATAPVAVAAEPHVDPVTEEMDLVPAVAPTEGEPAPPPPPRAPRKRRRWPLAVAAVALLGASGLVGLQLLGSDPSADAGPDDPTSGESDLDPDRAALDAIVEEDRATVDEVLLDVWAPQLDVFKDGVEDEDGTVYTYALIREKFESFLASYPGAVLVRTDDWPSSFLLKDGYAPMLTRTFATPQEVNAWCDAEGFALDDCFAKRLTTSGEPADNIVLRDAGPGPDEGTPPVEDEESSPLPSESPSETPSETPTDAGETDPASPDTDPTAGAEVPEGDPT